MAVLYRKWRPQSLAEVVGQSAITQTLLHAIESGKVAHAYLFSGPRGTGKTSTGRILAKAVNCLAGGRGEPCNSCALCQDITLGRALDVIEVDAASNRGIEEIRQLRERVGFAPVQARYKVYIIDEVHMLTEPAANALLKTLEEPPAHVIFVLATTEPHKVLPTVLSRCQHFAFRRLATEAIASRLEFIAVQEGLSLPPPALRLIARSAGGSLRDAENTLEQALNLYGRDISLEQVRELLGLSADLRAREVVGHILAKEGVAGLEALARVVTDGVDLRAFHRQVVEYLRCLLLVKAGSAEAVEATAEELAEMKAGVAGITLPFLLRVTRLFSTMDQRWDGYSPLPLELALIESLGEEGLVRRESPLSETVVGHRLHSLPEITPDIGKPIRKIEAIPVDLPKPLQKPQTIETPQPQPAAVQDSGGELTLASVQRRWRDFVNSLRGQGSGGDLDARLRSACDPVQLQEGVLELAFRHQYHYKRISDPKYVHLVEQGLKEFFGHPLKLKLSPPTERPLNQDPLVRAALEAGARIVEKEER